MLKNINIIFKSIIAITLLWVVYQLLCPEKKVAVVRSAYIVENYKGIQEVNVILESRVNQFQANLDSLQSDLEKNLKQHNLYIEDLAKLKAEDIPESIYFHKNNYERYLEIIKEKAFLEKEQLMQGALNQINTYVKEYAEEKGYDLVIGLLPAGNILYANDVIDITDEVLKGINQEYNGQNK